MDIFHNFFGWIIRELYSFTGNYAFSIVLMTILFNLMILPLTLKSMKSSANMQKIQPEMKKIQEKYKNDKEMLNKKMLELYSENNVNPLAGCLPMLIQMPIILALYAVMKDPINYVFLGDKVIGTPAVSQGLFWIHDLSLPDMLSNVLNFGFAGSLPGLLPILTAIVTYIQMEVSMPKNESPNASAGSSMGTMKIVMPLMILMFSHSLSAGIVLYWFTGTIFRIAQQFFINKDNISKEAN